MLIFFTGLILHFRDHLHMAPPPLRLHLPRPWGLFLGNFNIRNVRGLGLAQAIQEVHIGGFDLMILTDTNTTSQAY